MKLLTKNHQLAAYNAAQAADQRKQCCLATTRGAGEQHDFAAVNIQVEPEQHLMIESTLMVSKVEPSDQNGWAFESVRIQNVPTSPPLNRSAVPGSRAGHGGLLRDHRTVHRKHSCIRKPPPDRPD